MSLNSAVIPFRPARWQSPRDTHGPLGSMRTAITSGSHFTVPSCIEDFPQDIQAFSVSQAFAPDRFRDLFRAHLGLMCVHDCRSCTAVSGDHVIPNAKARHMFMMLLLKASSARKAQQLPVLTVYWPRKRRYNSMFCSFPERLRPCKVHPDDIRSHADAVQPLKLGKIHVSSVEFLLLSVRPKTNTLQSSEACSCQQRAPSKRACVLLRLTRCIVVLTVRRVCNSPSLCVCVCTFVLGCLPAYALHPLTRFCGRFFVVTDPPSTDQNTHPHDLDAG